MGDNPIIGVRSSSQNNAALTVGGAKPTYLPLSSNRGMQGKLNLSRFRIMNLKPFVEDDSSQSASDAPKNDVINFGYFHTQRGELRRLINDAASESLSRTDNDDKMEVNLNMNTNSIINLRDPLPSNSHYAATVNFVR